MNSDDFNLLKLILKQGSKSIIFWDELNDAQVRELNLLPKPALEEIILFRMGDNIKKFLQKNNSVINSFIFFDINKNHQYMDVLKFCRDIRQDIRAFDPFNEELNQQLEQLYDTKGYKTNFIYALQDNEVNGNIQILDFNKLTMDGKYLILEAASRGICHIEHLLMESDKLKLEPLTLNKLGEVANALKPDTFSLNMEN